MLKIERLEKTETTRLKQIRLRALHNAPDAFGSTYKETVARPLSSWIQQLDTLVTFVAVMDGADVGMVRGAHDDVFPSQIAWLISMWVDPKFRGHGIGKSLIQAMVCWARAENKHQILLDVGDDNAPAIALYTRMGFTPNGVTSTMDPPRDHVTEHQQVFVL